MGFGGFGSGGKNNPGSAGGAMGAVLQFPNHAGAATAGPADYASPPPNYEGRTLGPTGGSAKGYPNWDDHLRQQAAQGGATAAAAAAGMQAQAPTGGPIYDRNPAVMTGQAPPKPQPQSQPQPQPQQQQGQEAPPSPGFAPVGQAPGVTLPGGMPLSALPQLAWAYGSYYAQKVPWWVWLGVGAAGVYWWTRPPERRPNPAGMFAAVTNPVAAAWNLLPSLPRGGD